jgi:hypothetical protein
LDQHLIDKKKAEAIIKRSEAELNKNKKELQTIEIVIRTLQDKVYFKGQLNKTLKSKNICFKNKKI